MLRKQYHLTQEELSLKSGVGLRFVRDLKQGKETLCLNKVNQFLDFFNYEMIATSKANMQFVGLHHTQTIKQNIFKGNYAMDILGLTKVISLFILTLIERDDGQKKQILETPANGSCV